MCPGEKQDQVKMGGRIRLITPAICLLITVGVLVGCLATTMHSADLVMHGTRAKATVVGLQYSRSLSRKSAGAYYPVLSFDTGNGQHVSVRSSWSTNMNTVNIGDIVEVLYKADEPTNVTINNPFNLWLVPSFLGIFGLLFGLASIVSARTHGQPVSWSPTTRRGLVISNALGITFACFILSCFGAFFWYMLVKPCLEAWWHAR